MKHPFSIKSDTRNLQELGDSEVAEVSGGAKVSGPVTLAWIPSEVGGSWVPFPGSPVNGPRPFPGKPTGQPGINITTLAFGEEGGFKPWTQPVKK